MKSLFSPLRILLLAVLIGAAGVGLLLIPPETIIPVHWDMNGEPDSWARRDIAVLVPLILVAGVWGLFAALATLLRVGDVDAGKKPMGVSLTGLTLLFTVLELVTVLLGLGFDINGVQALTFTLGGLLLASGWAMPDATPKSRVAPNISTAPKDRERWGATHRTTGALLMLGGGVLLVAALFAPTTTLVWWILACSLAPAAIAVGYSIIAVRRR